MKIKEKISSSPIGTATVFHREFQNEDGTKDVWYYNLDINKTSPIKTVSGIGKGYKEEDTEANIFDYSPKSKSNKPVVDDLELVNNMSLSKTQRKYIHPTNSKIIGYTRARMLGVID